MFKKEKRCLVCHHRTSSQCKLT